MRNRVFVTGILAVFAVLLFANHGFSNHAQYYVLDGFGGVHAGNGAPVISPATPYFGFDVATDIVYIPFGTSGSTGDGVLVLDDFGGVHLGGAAAGEFVPNTPYFGFDIARAIAYRNIPPRIAGNTIDDSNNSVTSPTFVSTISTTLYAPDDGTVLVACNANFGNNSGTDTVNARYAVGVTAGLHTFHCLARKIFGTADPLYYDSAITAIYIDQGPTGLSAVAGSQAGSEAGIAQ